MFAQKYKQDSASEVYGWTTKYKEFAFKKMTDEEIEATRRALVKSYAVPDMFIVSVRSPHDGSIRFYIKGRPVLPLQVTQENNDW